MTPVDTIAEQLARWRPTGPGPHEQSLAHGGAVVRVAAQQCDALAARLTEVTVTAGPPRACTPAELTDRAVRAAGRVTSLLDPLKVYEVDAGAGVAVLRSASPEAKAGQTQFYEVLLRGLHEAEVRRYASGTGKAGRVAVPFTLTHEAIAKLADDLLG
jgi:hypothetical protein